MSDRADLATAIVIATLVVLFFIGSTVLLFVIIHNRRNRHRAELAERDKEVMRAEREATEQTLGEVGRELHDNVGQLLTLAQMGIADVLEKVTDTPRLRAALNVLEEGIEEVRRLGRTLNSDTWQHRELADAISAEASRVERTGSIQVHLQVKGMPPMLPAESKTILYRVFQEVMNNALKHAEARRIEIILDGGPPFRMLVADNGRGFAPNGLGTGSGLANIRHRCALIGFTALLDSAPGKGCTWTIQQNEHAA